MGTTFTSIHVYSYSPIENSHTEFESFSRGWQTCVTDLHEEEDPFKKAKLISKNTDAPVLCFSIFDSEAIMFEIFQNGKRVSSFSDNGWTANKNLYAIPALIGYESGNKRRISNILGCSDAEEKTALLEEYFGVCLLPFPECFSDTDSLKREKSSRLYDSFMEKEKAVSGKRAPISLKLLAEYKGKIFRDHFTGHTVKKHCYLFGYATKEGSLAPCRFCGESLEPISAEEFAKDRYEHSNFWRFYHTDCDVEPTFKFRVTFDETVPEAYRGKAVTIPDGLFPAGFDSKGRLVLSAKNKVCIADENMQIIAKLSVKGDVEDIVDDCLLVTRGDSFCGYEFDPKAVVRIYRMVDKTAE